MGKEVKVDQPKPKDAPKSQDQRRIPNSRESISVGSSAIACAKGKQPQTINIQQPTPPRPAAKIPSHHEIIEIPDSSPSPSSASSPQSPTNSASISPTNLPSAETILALIDARNADDAVVRELAGIYRRQRAAEEAVDGADANADAAEGSRAVQEQDAQEEPVIVETGAHSQNPIGDAAPIGGVADVVVQGDVQMERRLEVPGATVYVPSAINPEEMD